MKNIDRIRARSVEEVAKSRLTFEDITGSDEYGEESTYGYNGDFGIVIIKQKSGKSFAVACELAYAEALRLEIEWLNKEEENRFVN